MESALWALNLVAVCLFCIWALREDERKPQADDTEPPATPQSARKPGPNAAQRQNRR